MFIYYRHYNPYKIFIDMITLYNYVITYLKYAIC